MLLVVAACDKTAQPPLAIGAEAWSGHEPVFLAETLGFYQGSNMRLQAFRTPAETEEAFRGGKIQVAAVTLEEAFMLRRDMPDLKIILVLAGAPDARLDVLVTRDETVGRYHSEMKILFDGWRRAMDEIQAGPERTTALMARHEGISPAEFLTRSKGVERYDLLRNQGEMIGEPPPISAMFDAAQRRLLSQGRLKIGVDASMLLDSTLLAETHK